MDALQKPQTLRSGQQFRQVYTRGQRFHTPFFSAFVLKNDDGKVRVGLTVTRKVGNAVVRNRCKRRFREVIRKHPFPDSVSGFDLVLNAKSEMIEAAFTQIEDAFKQAIEKFYRSLSKPR